MTLTKRQKWLLLVVLIVLVATQFWQRHWRTDETPEPGSLPVATADHTGFTLGSLTFTPCELERPDSGATIAAWCAPFEVPENRANPDGRRIALKLALIKSNAQVPKRDLVVLLAGGPGQAATQSYAQMAGALAPLRKHRSILLLDQRGTGASNALTCPKPLDGGDGPRNEQAELKELRDSMSTCLAAVREHADPAMYTTTAAVEDLEAVRKALGKPRFDLLGVSYGTRLAQQYLMRHPDGVRSVVLDSVVPNELTLGAEFAMNLDTALKAQFADCDKTPECAKVFADSYATLRALRDRLAERPVEVSYHDPRSFQQRVDILDADMLAGLARLFAYSPTTSALLPLVIEQASAGNYAPLLGQIDFVKQMTGDLATSGMQYSVICSEDADRLAPRPQDADLMLGNTLINAFHAACEIWPHGAMPDDFHTPIASDKPVLILEGQYDPVTPPRYGESVLKGLPNGRLLVAGGQGHNVIGQGCIPRLTARFVEKLDAGGLDAGCIADLGPLPAFINYNGAGP